MSALALLRDLGCNDKDRAGNALRGIVGKRLTCGGGLSRSKRK